jgi:GNAT superfamily N-acetyltransferase
MADLASIDIGVEDEPSGAIADELAQKLVEALRQNTPPSDARLLTLLARDARQAMIGGLIGSTSYGWLLVKMLWVAEELRGHGLGARIMAEAEAIARSRGCHGAWLDTSSARAERFYIRLGYAPFGVLTNGPGERPQGHRRAFLAKRLIEERKA